MITPALAAELGELERRRLRYLVEARIDEADPLHATDFQLTTPSGRVWNKQEYLGGIADGSIDYRRFEPVSEIEVMSDGDLAVLRYRSLIDIAVAGQQPGPLECWHLDCYRRDGDRRDGARRDGDRAGSERGGWQVRWSQATEILRRRAD